MDFVDLKTQYSRIKPQILAGFESVLERGAFIMGQEIGHLEKRLAEFVGTPHCLTCSSGTDALVMALMARGIGRGDAVLTTPFTFIATAEAVALVGATPVFVDVDPDTFNIDPSGLETAARALSNSDASVHVLPRGVDAGSLSLKGVITVDLFGQLCDYEAIEAFSREKDLFLLEDAAQSFGASQHGRRSCSYGHAAATSFFPAKPLGCYGDGGAVFTNDPELAAVMASIRVHGKGSHKYDNARVGLNARLDTLQAAVLLAKLDIFEEELELRQKIAEAYTQKLVSLGGLSVPSTPHGCLNAWAQYSILLDDPGRRDSLAAGLKAKGVPTAVYYPKPLHLQSAFTGLGYRPGDFPVSENLSERILSLPMHPYLTEEQLDSICEAISECLTS